MSSPPKKQAPSHRKSEPRGGFIVLRRGDRRGDLMAHVRPSEHSTIESAYAEAQRLAALHDREFVVFREVASTALAGAVQSEAA